MPRQTSTSSLAKSLRKLLQNSKKKQLTLSLTTPVAAKLSTLALRECSTKQWTEDAVPLWSAEDRQKLRKIQFSREPQEPHASSAPSTNLLLLKLPALCAASLKWSPLRPILWSGLWDVLTRTSILWETISCAPTPKLRSRPFQTKQLKSCQSFRPQNEFCTTNVSWTLFLSLQCLRPQSSSLPSSRKPTKRLSISSCSQLRKTLAQKTFTNSRHSQAKSRLKLGPKLPNSVTNLEISRATTKRLMDSKQSSLNIFSIVSRAKTL